jgi:hypothetical protein
VANQKIDKGPHFRRRVMLWEKGCVNADLNRWMIHFNGSQRLMRMGRADKGHDFFPESARMRCGSVGVEWEIGPSTVSQVPPFHTSTSNTRSRLLAWLVIRSKHRCFLSTHLRTNRTKTPQRG